MRVPSLLAASLVAALGCSDTPTSTAADVPVAADVAPPTGTLVLKFGTTNTVRKSPNLEDPLLGTVYGNIYLAEDVTLTGPRDGAVAAVAGIQVEDVDLRTSDVSTASWTSPPLAPGEYMFLGMLDVDANAAESDEGPDTGDPVTLPINTLTVVAQTESAFTVPFDLVYAGTR